jgi:hypothetical protein
MNANPSQPAQGAVDPSEASAARAYQYAGGGKDHYQRDRETAEEIMSMSPDAARAAVDNRAFLSRAVAFVAGNGVRQFLDIGAGLPLPSGNVHEWAKRADRTTRTVYVDRDPAVVISLQAQVEFIPEVRILHGDLRNPEYIMESPQVTRTLNLSQPVAVVLGAVLHFADDSTAFDSVEYIKRVIMPGSYLIISHATADGAAPGEAERVQEKYADEMKSPLSLRTKNEIARFFDGFRLMEPGVVNVTTWRTPCDLNSRTILYGGAGVKPLPKRPPRGTS